MTSRGGSGDAQPLYSRLWSSGFLPTQHSGVKFRNSGDPVYYLSNPDGIDRDMRRDMLDDLGALNRRRFDLAGRPGNPGAHCPVRDGVPDAVERAGADRCLR